MVDKRKKIDDPFTRRSTKPCMKLRAKAIIDDSLVSDVDDSNNVETNNDIKVSKKKFSVV